LLTGLVGAIVRYYGISSCCIFKHGGSLDLVVRNPQELWPGLGVLRPFTFVVWMCVIATIITACFGIYLILTFSNGEIKRKV